MRAQCCRAGAKLSDGSERAVSPSSTRSRAVGAGARGLLAAKDVDAIERRYRPGEGVCAACNRQIPWKRCDGTWACSVLAQRGAAMRPDRRRDVFARHSGPAVVELPRRGIHRPEILTKGGVEKRDRGGDGVGGSTKPRCCSLWPSPMNANVKLRWRFQSENRRHACRT